MLRAAFLLIFSAVPDVRVTQTTGQELPKRQTLPCAGEPPNSVKSRGKGGKIACPSWHGACDSFGGRLSLEFGAREPERHCRRRRQRAQDQQRRAHRGGEQRL